MKTSEDRKIKIMERVGVDPESGCWNWLAGKNDTGYGYIHIDGTQCRAHRIAYEAWCGPIADGHHILHACDNPACCNPMHLSAGTHSENMIDMCLKGRQGNQVVGPEDVNAIRNDPRVYRLIADDYGICPAQVSRIKTGKRWGYLPMAA